MDRRLQERRIITGLLILLGLEVILLTLHLMWGGFRPRHSGSATALAGEVSVSEHELRKRSLNSLVWEKTATHDSIYYYDSILTLSQSTAQLKLFKNTDLRLSENTLVTIEPPSDDKHGEIRLQFHKGGFKARNPYATTEVKSDNWSMEIKSGSEVELHQAGASDYELQVTKGEVDFKGAGGGESHVTQDQVLRIDDKAKATQLQILPDDALHWVDPPQRRLYTHKKEIQVTVHWQGQHPTQLVRQTLGGVETAIPLVPDAEQATLTLPIGHHELYLRNENKSSQALDLEVWSAPVIHLISPLPRNRVKLAEPISFVWTWRPEVSVFHLRLRGKNTLVDQVQKDNTFTTHFDNEDDAEWRVEAEDQDGFLIPAPYSYPIFMREAPLAAPRLKSPTLRRPARDDGASFLWRLEEWLLPSARAEEAATPDYQAVFQWEPVEKADSYVIEISETADFRTPLISKAVAKNEFVWKHMKLKSYYWRVAAEAKNRMGFFSEPEEINLADNSYDNIKVTAMKKTAPAADEAAEPVVEAAKAPVETVDLVVIKPAESAAKSAAETKAPEAKPPSAQPKFEFPKERYRGEWRPNFSSISSSRSGMSAKLSGFNPYDLGFHADLRLAGDHALRVDGEYASAAFTPDPPSHFPAQSNLDWPDVHVSAVIHNNSSVWGYGAGLQTLPQFSRATDTSISVKNGFAVTPMLENWHRWSHSEYYGQYGLILGSEFGLQVSQSIRWETWESLVIGATVTLQELFGSGTTNSLSGQLTFGWQF